MKQEDTKMLLLKDLCSRLPYGVKVMIEGWDSDMDCEFTTVETLIGIDDRFIHTIWDKTGDKDKHSIIEPLSILDYKPFLRPMSSMTEEEKKELNDVAVINCNEFEGCSTLFDETGFDWLNAHHFDYRGLIPMGLAIEITEENNPYKY